MIKNIIFDIGNVLLDYTWEKPFIEYGVSLQEARRIDSNMLHDEIWYNYDCGLVDHDEATRQFMDKYPDDAGPIKYFMEHMKLIKIDRPEVYKKLPLLKEKGYRLYLLSNYTKDLLEDHLEGTPVKSYADGEMISYQAGVGKPHRAIYEALLDKYSLRPEECIFYDDIEANTRTAENIGIKAITISSKEQLLSELEKLI